MNKEKQLREFIDTLIRFAPNPRNIATTSTVDDLLTFMRSEAAALYLALYAQHDMVRARDAAQKITGVLMNAAVMGVFTETEARGLQDELQSIMEKF